MPLTCLLVAAGLVCAAPATATVIQVPTDFPTIQEAVNHAAPGDEILVLPGTYAENVSLVGMSSIAIRSQSGPASAIVDGGFLGPVVSIESAALITLEGFTLRRGTLGVGIAGSSGVQVRHNIIQGNIGRGDGGGIAVLDSNASIEDNDILDNRANVNAGLDGGGIYFHGTSGNVTGNRIQGNLAHEGGGLIINQPTASLVVAGNLFIDNEATLYGGGIYVNRGVRAEIRSNTFAGNSAGAAGGGIWYTEASVPVISRNIVAGNSAATGGGVHAFLPGASASFSCNDAWDNQGGNYTGYQADPTGMNGNIALDPHFCNPGAGDWRIDEISPCSPARSPAGCGLIGALEVGCGVIAVDQATWGAIKARYAQGQDAQEP